METVTVIDVENESKALKNKMLKKLINTEGVINLDFKDIQTVVREKALYGSSEAFSIENIKKAAQEVIASILMVDKNAFKEGGVIVNITTGKDISLLDAQGFVEYIESLIKPVSVDIWGLVVEDSFKKGQIKVEIMLPTNLELTQKT
jgi:cell division protein FtsZ